MFLTQASRLQFVNMMALTHFQITFHGEKESESQKRSVQSNLERFERAFSDVSKVKDLIYKAPIEKRKRLVHPNFKGVLRLYILYYGINKRYFQNDNNDINAFFTNGNYNPVDGEDDANNLITFVIYLLEKTNFNAVPSSLR